MNTSTCASGWATDELFQANEPGKCDTPLVAYYLYAFFIVGMKYLTFGRITMNWISRRKPRMARHVMNSCSVFPVAPATYFVFAIINTLVIVLGGLNIITFRNGWALALYSLAYLQFAWTYSNGLIRLVRLGDKIIPMSHRQYAENKGLASFDVFGKVLLGSAVTSFALSSIVLIVLGPITPSNEKLFFQIGFASKALYAASTMAGYVYHLERCVNVINQVDIAVRDHHTGPNADDLGKVIKKMRTTQVLHMLVGFPALAPLILLAADAIPANVWLVLLPAAFEAMGNLYYSCSLRGGKARNKKVDARNGGGVVSKSKSGTTKLALTLTPTLTSDYPQSSTNA